MEEKQAEFINPSPAVEYWNGDPLEDLSLDELEAKRVPLPFISKEDFSENLRAAPWSQCWTLREEKSQTKGKWGFSLSEGGTYESREFSQVSRTARIRVCQSSA